jgi:hypothetical protein
MQRIKPCELDDSPRLMPLSETVNVSGLPIHPATSNNQSGRRDARGNEKAPHTARMEQTKHCESDDNSRLMPLSQAVRVVGLPLHPATIRRHLARGSVSAERIGAKWHVKPCDLIAALVKKSGPAAGLGGAQ